MKEDGTLESTEEQHSWSDPAGLIRWNAMSGCGSCAMTAEWEGLPARYPNPSSAALTFFIHYFIDYPRSTALLQTSEEYHSNSPETSSY